MKASAVPERPENSALASPGRLRALRQLGLSAQADPGMDRFARMVAGWLGVPVVALVSLVDTDRQVLPGQVGLAEPRAGTPKPLSRSPSDPTPGPSPTRPRRRSRWSVRN